MPCAFVAMVKLRQCPAQPSADTAANVCRSCPTVPARPRGLPTHPVAATMRTRFILKRSVGNRSASNRPASSGAARRERARFPRPAGGAGRRLSGAAGARHRAVLAGRRGRRPDAPDRAGAVQAPRPAGRRREQARRRRDDRHRRRRQGARPTATRCCSRRRPMRSARRCTRSCRSIRSRTSRRSR